MPKHKNKGVEMKEKCKIDGCDSPKRASGMCGKHYMRLYKHGDPNFFVFEKGQNFRWFQENVMTYDGDDCLTWPFDKSPKGYGRVVYKGKRVSTHRLVCFFLYGAPPDDKTDAAHSCGKGHEACVNPKHLRWASSKENHADKNIHGTIARGERNGNSKMNEHMARSVKEMLGTIPQLEIAHMHGVSRSAVRDISIGKSWAWL